jgi:branched-chain amino acid transport system ATP-binding protein
MSDMGGASHEILLESRNVGKRFGGVQALKDVSLTIRKNEIYGLIGPNGAGKTTFFNVLTGLYQRDEGEVLFEGQILNLKSPHEVAKVGIARTFQNIRLFGNMTALENVMVGRHVRTHQTVIGAIFRTKAERTEEAEIRRRAIELLHYVGIADRADDLVWVLEGRRDPAARCRVLLLRRRLCVLGAVRTGRLFAQPVRGSLHDHPRPRL